MSKILDTVLIICNGLIYFHLTTLLQGLGDHNYCRNPDNDVRPWCWVNATAGSFGYCALPDCQSVNTTTVPTSTVSTLHSGNGTEANSTTASVVTASGRCCSFCCFVGYEVVYQ